MTKQDKIYSDLIQHPIKNVNDYPYDDLKYGMLFIDTVNNTANLCEDINSENRTIKPYNDGIMYDKDYLNFENRKFMLYNIIANLNLKLFPLNPVLYLEIDKINYIQSTSSKYFEMYKQKLNEMFKTIIINKNDDLNNSLDRSDLINFNDHFNALLYIENYTYESEQNESEQNEIEDTLEYFKFKQDTINKIYYYLNLNNI